MTTRPPSLPLPVGIAARAVLGTAMVMAGLAATALSGDGRVVFDPPTPFLLPDRPGVRTGVMASRPRLSSHDSGPLSTAPEKGTLPSDRSTDLFSQTAADSDVSRGWSEQVLLWAPSQLEHQPIYFDDVPLERYGQTLSPVLQPVVSGVRFFGTLPILPYLTGLDHPGDRVSTLGYYRTGSRAPCIHQTVPFQFDAATLEAGAWAGLIFALP